MRTILLGAGLDTLGQQNQSTVDFIEITNFALGSAPVTEAEMELWDEAEPPLATMQGTVVLNSDDGHIYYTPDTYDTVKLICWVPSTVAEIPITSVTLFSTFRGVTAPFCFCASPNTFVKLMAGGDQGQAPGFDWWFALVLKIPNLGERFSFGNLVERRPTFAEAPSELLLPSPALDGHDNFLVQSHTLDGRPSLPFNSRNVHWGMSPPMQPLIPGDALVLSGGRSGDGYLVDFDVVIERKQITVFRRLGLRFSLVSNTGTEDFAGFDYYLTLRGGNTVAFTGSTKTGELYTTDTALMCAVTPAAFPLTLDGYNFVLERTVGLSARTTVLAGTLVVRS